LLAHFSYIPDQVFLPIGLINEAATLTPDLHAHAGSALPWLHLDDGLPRHAASSRDALNE